jgi:intracellular multiplication protein IcmW
MPDLSTEAVHQFWYDYDKRVLYRIVTSLEGMETWAVDTDEQVNVLFNQLGQALDSANNIELQEEATLVKILANTHSARAIRLMQYLDAIKPGLASKLLMYAEQQTKEADKKDPYCDLFLKRNLVFERLQLLSRVFAPERINLVLKALENINEE